MINIGWVHFCDLIVCRVFEKRTNEGKLFLGGKCEKVFERKKKLLWPSERLLKDLIYVTVDVKA
jgi:hypothetical protein